jgi:hypothetical protein
MHAFAVDRSDHPLTRGLPESARFTSDFMTARQPRVRAFDAFGAFFRLTAGDPGIRWHTIGQLCRYETLRKSQQRDRKREPQHAPLRTNFERAPTLSRATPMQRAVTTARQTIEVPLPTAQIEQSALNGDTSCLLYHYKRGQKCAACCMAMRKCLDAEFLQAIELSEADSDDLS